MRSSCHCHAPSPVAMADTRGLCQDFVGQQVTVSAVGQRVSLAGRGAASGDGILNLLF